VAPEGSTPIGHVRRMILEARIDGSVIRGTLTLPEGEAREFHGWLELTTAIEAAAQTGDEPRPRLPS
jgi:hypothetical protein